MPHAPGYHTKGTVGIIVGLVAALCVGGGAYATTWGGGVRPTFVALMVKEI